MKILFGAMLASCGFLLIPSIHKTVAKALAIERQKLAFLGLIAIIVLIFAILPMRAQYVLGLLFIAMAILMKWIVPKNEKLQKYISEVLFGGVDITDDNAPYSKVVNLFKLPLFALGLWVIAPATMIILDIGAIAGAFYYWYRMSNKAKKQLDINEGLSAN